MECIWTVQESNMSKYCYRESGTGEPPWDPGRERKVEID